MKNIKKNLYSCVIYSEIGIITLLGLGINKALDSYSKAYLKRHSNVYQENQVNNIIYLNNVKELDNYVNQEITFQDVRDVLRNNPNLENNDKDLINELIDKLEEKTPYLNLKCLYENIKLLQINRLEQNNSNLNIVGSFDSYNHYINIYVNLFSDDSNILKHELLHTAHSLVLDTEKEVVKKNFCLKNNKVSFLEEGFISWFKNYLFPESRTFEYKDLVQDINIFKYIMGVNNKELITIFTEGNYKDILNPNIMHLDNREIEELINIYDKEFNYAINIKNVNVTIDELTRKYNLLLKACIYSHQDNMNIDTVYQIQNLLYDSYSCYKDTYLCELQDLRKNLLKQTIKVLPTKNNEIKITNFYDKKIDYCDFNNLVLIYNKNGTGVFKYIIGEEYNNINNKKTYYVDDDFITYNKENDNKIFHLRDVAKSLLPSDELSLIDIGDYLEEKHKHKEKIKIYKRK